MENKSIPQATSPLAAWLSYLENLHSKTIDMGLERVSQVAARLDVLKPAPFVFTVAGTNGKGTTCRTLEAVLMAAGYKVGVYSSPHLVRYTERVRVQNSELPESAHTASFAEIEAARGEISLTYFEYGTLAALRASGLAVSEQAIRDGIQNALLPGRFQIVSDAPRLILDVAHNPHAAAYLAARLKSLPKTGRVLAVIGMLHDKDIGGTLACMESVVDSWYCAPLEGPRGATAEQLLEHLGKGAIYNSVAQAWQAAMADAKPEDTVLVCGSFHTVAHVMEVMDAGRTGGE